METRRYAALIRGINVGGKNIIRMADLRDGLNSSGYQDVATYIQSGNVFFTAPVEDKSVLSGDFSRALRSLFGVDTWTLILDVDDLQKILSAAPESAGDPAHRWDVIFLRPTVNPPTLMAKLPLKEGVDQVWPGPGVLYFARLNERASSSRLSTFVSMPEYKETTIRNWNTTRKISEMLGDA